MKPYIIFSRGCGPEEGAALAFGSSVKEVRRMAWKSQPIEFEDYIDLGVRLLKESNRVTFLADQDKLKAGIPHIVDSPEYCQSCQFWGAGITSDGLCGMCNEYPGDKLIKLFDEAKKQAEVVR